MRLVEIKWLLFTKRRNIYYALILLLIRYMGTLYKNFSVFLGVLLKRKNGIDKHRFAL